MERQEEDDLSVLPWSKSTMIESWLSWSSFKGFEKSFIHGPEILMIEKSHVDTFPLSIRKFATRVNY